MIGDCMKRQVASVSPGTTVLGAARLVVDRHIGTLPVVDEQGTLIGVVPRPGHPRHLHAGFRPAAGGHRLHS